MADYGKEIIQYMMDDPKIKEFVDGKRIHQNTVPQTMDEEYIWFIRRGSGEEEDQCVDQDRHDFRVYYDVEIHSPNINRAIDMAEVVKLRFDRMTNWPEFGRRGAILLDIQDHSDDYIPRNNFSEDGLDVASLDLQVIARTSDCLS